MTILKLVPPHAFTVRQIVWCARPGNMLEMRAVFGASWRERGTEWICAARPYHWVVTADDMPICVFGMSEFARGRWSLYMVGTEAVEQCGRPLARLLKRTFREWAEKVKPVSAECNALKGNPKSTRWFAFLGAKLARETATHEIYSFGGMPCVSAKAQSQKQRRPRRETRKSAKKP